MRPISFRIIVKPPTLEKGPDRRTRAWVIAAALVALFLGAMDSLIMSTAMPTIVAELGGMHLYAWVYSAYFLSRAVSLPVFGKLADLYANKTIFLISIGLFVISSVAAGLSDNMSFLIGARVFQGIGAGGNFALVYIVLADVSPVGERARTMSFASSIWGVASVLGPTLGGFIVTFLSWRWIFFINVPLGLLSMAGLFFFLVEMREKKKAVHIDIGGAVTLSTAILGILSVFLTGGRSYAWVSPQMALLWGLTLFSAVGFYLAERRAKEPILPLDFFKKRSFSTGNLAVFMSSFSIFSLFAFAPVFIQGAQGRSPMRVGLAMLSLSMGWSAGSVILGQISNRLDNKRAALAGAVMLIAGCALTLTFTVHTTMTVCFWVFFLIGLGMGFTTLATLVIVQNSVDPADLGVATSSNQFARTLGGTVGVGICGGFMNTALWRGMEKLVQGGVIPTGEGTGPAVAGKSLETLLQPEFQERLSETARMAFQKTVAQGVSVVFWVVFLASLGCLLLCAWLPGDRASES